VFGRNVQLQTNADVIAETFEDMATVKRQIVDFSDHTQVWRRPSKKCLRISTNGLYCQKLDSLSYIFTSDSIGLRLLLFTQLSLNVEPSESKTASTKSEFYMIQPLKVILGHSFCNQSQADKG